MYKSGDKVLLKNVRKTKNNQEAYLRPYTITTVNEDNGTVTTRKGRVMDMYNIRNINPYKE